MRRRLTLAAAAAVSCLLAAPVTVPPARASADLLTRTDLLTGTNIGVWETGGGPALHDTTVLSGYRALDSRVWEWGAYDCFTGETCGTDHHAGTLDKAAFTATWNTITGAEGRIPWLRMVPVSSGNIGGITGSVFCPPADGSNWGMNLPLYESELQAISAVYTGPVVLEVNEPEWDCYRAWGFSGGGSPGVSADIARMWSATFPALKAYARSLGFSQVVTVGYIGVGGGTGWGSTCTASGGAPYGYACTISSQWVDEFNNQLHSDYAANGNNPDYIPDAESIHTYAHSADMGTNPYTFDDSIAYAYYREWLLNARSRVDSIWGAAAGDQIRFADSEWQAGMCDSYPGNCWSGWGQAGAPGTFDDGFLAMLRGDGNTAGAGTAWWSAELFEVASDTGIPGPGYYNVINPDGTTPDWYGNIKADFAAINSGTPQNTVTVTSPGSQSGTAGVPASLQMTAADSDPAQALTWSAAGLPPGLAISPGSGLISGTPSAAGTYSVTVTAADTTGASGRVTFTWAIARKHHARAARPGG